MSTSEQTGRLLQAAVNGRLEEVRALLKEGVHVDAASRTGTALVLVVGNRAGKNRLEMTRLLIDAGANLEAKNEYGRTPLLEAVWRLAFDASSERLNGIGEGGPTIPENEMIVRLLLDRRANPNVADTIKNGDAGAWTPLHTAAWGGVDTAVHWLIEAGASLNVRDNAGCTPLDKAREMERSGATAILKAAGAKRGSFWNRLFG